MSKVKAVNRNVACQRLRSIGLDSTQTVQILDTVEKWCRCSGEEWTVARLKTLKQNFVQLLAGQKVTGEWIARDSRGYPKGAFHTLFERSLSRSGPRKRRYITQSLYVLSLYSQYITNFPTWKQWDKFRSAVEAPAAHKVAGLPQHFGVQRYKDLGKYDQISLADLPGSPERRVPCGLRTSIRESDIGAWLPSHLEDADRLGALEHPRLTYMKKLHSICRGENPEWNEAKDLDYEGRILPSNAYGRVSFIQEPGYKLRAIANPNRVIQAALVPMQTTLLAELGKISNDCTFNQNKGVERVQSALKSNKTVYSVDLSDATSNFPLTYSISMVPCVKKLRSDDVRLFINASEGKWVVKDPISRDVRYISWKKGQPLGLAPSFPIFALSHHEVLSTCGAKPSDYVILGDDIAIFNGEIAKKYFRVMETLGCPISSQKSLISSSVAEFAGKVITKDSIVPSFKWRLVSDKNFLEVARVIGPSSLGLLRPRQRAVAKAIAPIPEFFGGLGWNSEGESLQQRLTKYEPVISMLQKSNDTVGVDAHSKRIVNAIRFLYLDKSDLSDKDRGYLESRPGIAVPVLQRLHDIFKFDHSVIPEDLYLCGYRRASPEFIPSQLRVMERKLAEALAKPRINPPLTKEDTVDNEEPVQKRPGLRM
ncbi:MAG: RNA-dependent RNA polymerase [Hangzhou mitovirus 1]|nr:MAG: RNA-dependent RNA polymerase [Hangzhou mitovirus 1]